MGRHKMACIGIGGYAAMYVEALVEQSRAGRVQAVALVDPKPPANCDEYMAALSHDHPKLYGDFEKMLVAHPDLDAVAIGTPLYLHEPMVVRAAQAGCHVLCAKPATTIIQSIIRLIATGR